MLSRVTVGARQVTRPVVHDVPQRTMATASVLRTRIRAVKNVKKITSVMKMVAASKLRNAQRVLDISRKFQHDVVRVWPDPVEAQGEKFPKVTFVSITSDSGLCGGVNSAVVRLIKKEAAPLVKASSGTEVSMILFGAKGQSGLSRAFANQFKETWTDIGKLKFLTFRQVSQLAHPLVTSENRLRVAYNLFRSSVSYDTQISTILPFEKALGDGKFLESYEIEGDTDALKNFYEFRTAVRMFHWMAEADAATLSSRMNAMENSSKNAGDMIKRLSSLLNRTRQAKITTELIEIISGAVAAEEMHNK